MRGPWKYFARILEAYEAQGARIRGQVTSDESLDSGGAKTGPRRAPFFWLDAPRRYENKPSTSSFPTKETPKRRDFEHTVILIHK